MSQWVGEPSVPSGQFATPEHTRTQFDTLKDRDWETYRNSLVDTGTSGHLLGGSRPQVIGMWFADAN